MVAKKRTHRTASGTTTPLSDSKSISTRRPSVGAPKQPATTLKPKPAVPRFGLLTPQATKTARSSSSSRDSSPIESRLYFGSVCYITEDLLKRVAKTKVLGEVKTLKLSFPDSKVVVRRLPSHFLAVSCLLARNISVPNNFPTSENLPFASEAAKLHLFFACGFSSLERASDQLFQFPAAPMLLAYGRSCHTAHTRSRFPCSILRISTH